jgi:hypothetical protein
MKTFARLLITLSACLLIAGTSEIATAQQTYYKHMEGNIGGNINIVADLIRIEGNISGYYYYFFKDKEGNASWTHYGKSMPVTGKLGKDQSIEFQEYDQDVKGSLFQGSVKNNELMTGTWQNAEATKKLPFELHETYPAGTMAFKVYYLNDETPLVKGPKSPKATIELILLVPTKYPDAFIQDTVTKIICEDFFREDRSISDPTAEMQHEKEHYFTNYIKGNEEIYDGGSSFNWEKIKALKIQHNENYILSLETYDYGYTGGAHGLPVSKFKVIDLKTGHIFILDDIFRPEYMNDLRDIVNAELRKKYNLAKDQSLKDAGFFEHFVEPSTNFYVNKDGIGFYYNRYDVAPFTMGSIDVFVNFQNLKRIMKTDGPLFELTGQQP